MTLVDITKIGGRTIKLPSFAGSEVKLKKALTIGEIEDIRSGLDPALDDFDEKVGQAIILHSIISWNLAAGEGLLPVEMASLKMLPLVDFQFLVQEVTGEKKLDENGSVLSAEKQEKETKKK